MQRKSCLSTSQITANLRKRGKNENRRHDIGIWVTIDFSVNLKVVDSRTTSLKWWERK